jgi:hypothetical protein
MRGTNPAKRFHATEEEESERYVLDANRDIMPFLRNDGASGSLSSPPPGPLSRMRATVYTRLWYGGGSLDRAGQIA